MDKDVLVYVDLKGTPHLVGRLWARMRKDRESATFEYDRSWLTHSERFSLEPALMLGPGPFHTPSDRPLFGAIGDSAPDRWGRVLMRRAERRRAEREGQTPRSVREISERPMRQPGSSHSSCLEQTLETRPSLWMPVA
jgi:serine/threonine-protein kinase HipA